MPVNFIERPELRDRTRVFRNRPHAGEVLAEMLDAYCQLDAIVLAIPAGGVLVAAIAKQLHTPGHGLGQQDHPVGRG